MSDLDIVAQEWGIDLTRGSGDALTQALVILGEMTLPSLWGRHVDRHRALDGPSRSVSGGTHIMGCDEGNVYWYGPRSPHIAPGVDGDTWSRVGPVRGLHLADTMRVQAWAWDILKAQHTMRPW
jgi:hypothetical protein